MCLNVRETNERPRQTLPAKFLQRALKVLEFPFDHCFKLPCSWKRLSPLGCITPVLRLCIHKSVLRISVVVFVDFTTKNSSHVQPCWALLCKAV